MTPDLTEQLRTLARTIEEDAGWLHDELPDLPSPDGVATFRDIARSIAQTAHGICDLTKEPA